MENLKAQLKQKLKKASRIAVIGIGSELRADDGAGMLVARALDEACKDNTNVACFLTGSSPENFTGAIRKFNPTHIIIIDSADLGKEAGFCALIEPEDIGGVSFSTHRLPTKFLIDYLKTSLACEFVIVGIQPKTLAFTETLSPEVATAAGVVAVSLHEILTGCGT